MAFLGATLRELFVHDHKDVWLSIDGQERRQLRVMMAAIGNGRFFGGGMKICPDARLDDGALDLVAVGDLTRAQVVANIGRLFGGTHLELEQVTHARVTRLPPSRSRRTPTSPSSSTARRPATCPRRSRSCRARCASARERPLAPSHTTTARCRGAWALAGAG